LLEQRDELYCPCGTPEQAVNAKRKIRVDALVMLLLAGPLSMF
jgi:hypothetical protein